MPDLPIGFTKRDIDRLRLDGSLAATGRDANSETIRRRWTLESTVDLIFDFQAGTLAIEGTPSARQIVLLDERLAEFGQKPGRAIAADTIFGAIKGLQGSPVSDLRPVDRDALLLLLLWERKLISTDLQIDLTRARRRLGDE